ncbi:thioredoxin-like protein 4B [Trichonephila inaurata madagascariensis]|uniref:Thioredoxin-like protein 4B n=1 Tax=Trichonephila inaurata madagascariensis TaxID=2747483 RepID=A0A8X6Y9E4_9ARAC|nr:thioredoxin-like protein 4B [Trichonephila inaurata madagascariensis]
MNFLPQLQNKEEVDHMIRSVEDRVFVLRFGKENEVGTMKIDDVLLKTEGLLSRMATIATCNVDDVPEYVDYFEISHIPSTVYFFNTHHIKIESGMPDNAKYIGPFENKQDFIDLVEVVYRAAMRGKRYVDALSKPRVNLSELMFTGT